MFFRRGKKDKAEAPAETDADEPVDSASPEAPTTAEVAKRADTPPAGPPAVIHLSSSARSAQQPASGVSGAGVDGLGFATTADLEPTTAPVGQDKALEALDFGISMTGALDYNILVSGASASAALAFTRQAIAPRAAGEAGPAEWVLVAASSEDHSLSSVAVPAGRGNEFCRAVAAAAEEFAALFAAARTGDDFEARARTIEIEWRAGRDGALARLEREAEEQAIAILRTPTGFAMAPMHDGRIVKTDVFAGLPPSMQADIRERIATLEKRLTAILAAGPEAARQRRSALRELIVATAEPLARLVLDDVRSAYAGDVAATAALAQIEQKLVAEALVDAVEPGAGAATDLAGTHRREDAAPRWSARPPLVALLGEAPSGSGAPVVEDLVPTVASLLGRLDRTPASGLRVTPGSLHRANGGYLIVDAAALLDEPQAWVALKRALLSGRASVGVPTAQADHAEVPLALKVIVAGSTEACLHLAELDPALSALFKVEIGLAETAEASPALRSDLARGIAGLVARFGLRHLEATAVRRLIEEAGTWAGEPGRVCLDASRLADLAREADCFAARDEAKLIGLIHVERALAARQARGVAWPGRLPG
ncbi:MAG: AAA family ATPase [Hyphomicrobiaceae bacterium]|nr:AAA family ATPase [Hyphomicrobiaceae bacterium]